MKRRPHGSPAELSVGPLQIRPLTRRDRDAWLLVRLENEQWLQPWEASFVGSDVVSWRDRHTPATYRALFVRQRAGLRDGTQLPFGIFVAGQFVGQVNVAEIARGALCSGSIGYWIDRRCAGRNLIPLSVAMVADHAFRTGGIHRLEASIRPENTASLAVAGKVGFTNEGTRRKYLAVDGRWCDHLSWSLLADDYPEGVLMAMQKRHPDVTASLRPVAAGLPQRGI